LATSHMTPLKPEGQPLYCRWC